MKRTYQLSIGQNRFICRGRGVAGPDYTKALGTLVLIAATGAFTLAFPCSYFYAEFSSLIPSVLTCVFTLISLTFLILTSTSNPGILPKQLNGFSEGPRNVCTFQSQSLNYSGPTVTLPISGSLHKLKYCEECNVHLGCLYRPPRCSHCSKCDCCVERFDHHCPWLGNCIGRLNYRFFVCFLTSVSCTLVLFLAISCSQIISVSASHDGSIAEASEDTIPAWILIAMSLLGLLFVFSLCAAHVYLGLVQSTTKERCKGVWAQLGYNPFDRGGRVDNCLELWCTRGGPNRFKAMMEVPQRTNVVAICPSEWALSETEGRKDTLRSMKYTSIHNFDIAVCPQYPDLPNLDTSALPTCPDTQRDTESSRPYKNRK